MPPKVNCNLRPPGRQDLSLQLWIDYDILRTAYDSIAKESVATISPDKRIQVICNGAESAVCAVGKMPHRGGAALARGLEAWRHAWLDEWRRVSKESAVARMRRIICGWADYLRDR